MTDLLRSRSCGKTAINLNNGHTARSPGGVWGKRTEYLENKRLIEAIKKSLKGYPVKTTEGKAEYNENDLMFIFHKSTNEKNSVSSGAEILVPENASAHTQYEAFCLLSALCDIKGFRYRGVHTVTGKSPFKSLYSMGGDRAFLIKAGFIDSDSDNILWDKNFHRLAHTLSREIEKIYKERLNENYS